MFNKQNKSKQKRSLLTVTNPVLRKQEFHDQELRTQLEEYSHNSSSPIKKLSNSKDFSLAQLPILL